MGTSQKGTKLAGTGELRVKVAIRDPYAGFDATGIQRISSYDLAMTVFETPLPVYIGLKDQDQPAVLMATSVEVLNDGGQILELIFRDQDQIVGRFPRSAYVWWYEDRHALFD